MKLSEAIRAGAKIRPQCRMAFFGVGTAQQPIASCALGAAMEGAKLVEVDSYFPEHTSYVLVRQEWPEIKATTTCPLRCLECGDHEQEIEDLIQHFNDDCRWTREQIADWLEEKGY